MAISSKADVARRDLRVIRHQPGLAVGAADHYKPQAIKRLLPGYLTRWPKAKRI
jgi:hypothetical protein